MSRALVDMTTAALLCYEEVRRCHTSKYLPAYAGRNLTVGGGSLEDASLFRVLVKESLCFLSGMSSAVSAIFSKEKAR